MSIGLITIISTITTGIAVWGINKVYTLINEKIEMTKQMYLVKKELTLNTRSLDIVRNKIELIEEIVTKSDKELVFLRKDFKELSESFHSFTYKQSRIVATINSHTKEIKRQDEIQTGFFKVLKTLNKRIKKDE